MTERLIPVKLENYKPLREIVFEHLREAIIKGKLRPGERLMEMQLADEMGVSRTPVREAIRKLELEGLVIMIPRRGAYVADLSIKDVAETFEIRSALEALAASLAAERITPEEAEEMERILVRIGAAIEEDDMQQLVALDEEYHNLLYKASRNDRLMQILNNLREQIQRFRVTTLAVPGRVRGVLQEHRNIAEAISERNAELAHQLALEHIENAENALMDWMRRQKES
ncbi:MAG TPA: GntR family transcriptional regulator [Firmicutes bacterium]|jgi:DNA-binding GntR family transcriptional regulator|nr:GntR family transcriptional regulator [Bacillota bacterium]